MVYAKHKQVALVATGIVVLLFAGAFLFYTNDSFRLKTYDAYNAIFKIVVADRVLSSDATILSNIAYCSTNSPRQTLDLYIPHSPRVSPTPLVVFIHGGGWRAGDKSSQLLAYYGESMLERGYAIASLNYRLYPEATYPGPNDDIACAINHLTSQRKEYSLSESGWVLFGDSAGAQLGAYAMGDNSINEPFSTFVGFYGPYDLSQQINRPSGRDNEAWNYTDKGKSARQASPMFRDVKPDATYLLFHGEKDRIVNLSQSQRYAEVIQRAGGDVVFTKVKNADHYFSPRSVPTSSQIKQTVESIIETNTTP